MSVSDARRRIPRTDVLLGRPPLAEAVQRLGAATVKAAVTAAQARARAGELAPEEVAVAVADLRAGRLHPNAAKRVVARTVVDLYHGEGAGATAEAEFDQVFKDHRPPSEMPQFEVGAGVLLSAVLVDAGIEASRRAARRQIEQGGVRIDGTPVADDVALELGDRVVQVGRRKWLKLRVVET